MVKLDPTNAFHARVAERLTSEHVGWLVTVGPDGTPEPSPVWFLWDGADSILVYSRNMPKVANIANHGKVAFHLNSDENGEDVITLTGSATIDQNHVKAIDFEPYLAKYAQGIISIGMTNESFSAAFDQPVIISLEKLRGH